MKVRNLVNYSVLVGLGVFAASASAQQCVSGSGIIVEQEVVTASDFTSIDNTSIASVTILDSDTQSIIVKADDNVLEDVNLTVDNSVLTIALENGCYQNIDVDVEISQSLYENIKNSASGTIVSGNDLTLESLTVVSAGSGKISLSGTINDQQITVTGSGSINNYEVASSTVTASSQGSGNIEVSVSDRLTTSISGAGNIYYKGTPVIESENAYGSGQVIDADNQDGGANQGSGYGGYGNYGGYGQNPTNPPVNGGGNGGYGGYGNYGGYGQNPTNPPVNGGDNGGYGGYGNYGGYGQTPTNPPVNGGNGGYNANSIVNIIQTTNLSSGDIQEILNALANK